MRKLFIILILILYLKTEGQRNFYFNSSTGDDTRTSTQAQSSTTPWKTIAKLNSFAASQLPGDHFLFNRGQTFSGTINVTKSGNASNPIVFGAYGSGAKPVITSLVALGSWTSLGGNKYTATNASLKTGALNQSLNIVVINGQLANLGRYPNRTDPNKGYLTFTSYSGNTSITGNPLPFNPITTGGAEVVIRAQRWKLDRDIITNYNNGIITYQAYGGNVPGGANYGYFIQNNVSCLDENGEWCYTPGTKKVTMYYSGTIASQLIQAPTKDTGIAFKSGISFVTVDNLSVYGYNLFGICFNNNPNVTVTNTDINFSGEQGVHGSSNTNSLTFKDNTVYNSLSIGVRLTATDTVYIGGNTVVASGDVAGMGQSDSEPYQGIYISGSSTGKYRMIEHNIVKRSGYIGIHFNGDYTIVRENLIDTATYIKDDAGCIYTQGGATGTAGTNYKFMFLTNNICMNSIGALEGVGVTNGYPKGGGIYLDDNTNHVTMKNNFIANNVHWGIYFHTTRYSKAQDNFIYNSGGKQLYMQREVKVSPLNYDTLYGNVYFVPTLASSELTFEYDETGVPDSIRFFKKIDSNRYITPIDTNNIIKVFTTLTSSGTQRFKLGSPTTAGTWRGIYAPYDNIAFRSPVFWASTVKVSDSVLVLYNPTSMDSVVTLNSSYVDIYNKQYTPTTNYILKAWTGTVLLRSQKGTTSTNQPPTVSLTAPANGATVTTGQSVTISANASDLDGTVASVQFFQNGTLISTDNTSPYSIVWTPLIAGTYVITAKAFDNLSASTTSASVTITVSSPANIKPTVSVTAPANGATYTAPATVSITATAADADGLVSRVNFYSGSTFLGTDAIAPYAYSWTGVGVGGYIITAHAIDNSGDSTISAGISITVTAANIPPTCSLTNPPNGTTYTNPAIVNMTATAADADGTVVRVNFYDGATFLGTDATSPYAYTWNNPSVGTHIIRAIAIDNSGDSTASATRTITVNPTPNVKPTVSITAPSNGATYVAPATINITATASDADGSIVHVNFYNGGVFLGTDASSPYTLTLTNVPASGLSLIAIALDNSGDSTASSAISVTVSAPTNKAPVVSITSPANNATYSSPASITINATASDSDGTISRVDFYANGVYLGTDGSSPYSYSWASVLKGNYALTAVAYDNLGLSTTSKTINVIVNNTPPTVSITAPLTGATYTSPASVTFTANASDVDGSVVRVNYYNAGNFIGTATTNPYTVVWNPVFAGGYSITAVAVDNDFDSTRSAAINIIVNAAANIPPTSALTAPTNGATYTVGATVSIASTATDADGFIVRVNYYDGTNFIGTDATSPYTFSWTTATIGTHSITAIATDNKGDSTQSAPRTITVNPAANIPPTVSITSPTDNTSYTAPATVPITVTASDADGTVSTVHFYVNGIITGTDNTSPYSLTLNNLSPGGYILTAVAIDNAGDSTTSAAIGIRVDAPVNQPPTITISTVYATAKAPVNIPFTYVAADSDGSVVSVNFYNGSQFIGAGSAGTFTWANVLSGTYTVTAQATDDFGNITTSNTITVKVTGPPKINLHQTQLQVLP